MIGFAINSNSSSPCSPLAHFNKLIPSRSRCLLSSIDLGGELVVIHAVSDVVDITLQSVRHGFGRVLPHPQLYTFLRQRSCRRQCHLIMMGLKKWVEIPKTFVRSRTEFALETFTGCAQTTQCTCVSGQVFLGLFCFSDIVAEVSPKYNGIRMGITLNWPLMVKLHSKGWPHHYKKRY